jgi:hypothetical protein
VGTNGCQEATPRFTRLGTLDTPGIQQVREGGLAGRKKDQDLQHDFEIPWLVLAERRTF